MTQERKGQLMDSLNLIQNDCVLDAESLDGMPFTGLSVGTHFGQLYAMVSTIARTVVEVIEDA